MSSYPAPVFISICGWVGLNTADHQPEARSTWLPTIVPASVCQGGKAKTEDMTSTEGDKGLLPPMERLRNDSTYSDYADLSDSGVDLPRYVCVYIYCLAE